MSDGGGAERSRADLEAEWLELTRGILPGLARSRVWPVRADHCFQRILLDAVVGARALVIRSATLDPNDLVRTPRHIVPKGTSALLEAQFISAQHDDIEYGLGLAKATCFRAFRLDNPARLVGF